MRAFAVTSHTIYAAQCHNIIIKRLNTEHEEMIQIPEGKIVKDLTLSNDGSFLAAIADEKYLFVYECKDLSNVKRHTLPRAASKVRFTPDVSRILIADKTGDTYLYEWRREDAKCVKLLSHLSLLLDVLISDDSKYVITCDRDEKIRVSNYPNTYNVESYCLGHREFVVSVDFLPHDKSVLVSIAGDGSVRFWDYKIGKQLHCIDCNDAVKDKSIIEEYAKNLESEGIEVRSLPISRQSSCKIANDASLLAISTLFWNFITIYRINSAENAIHSSLFTTVALKYENIDFVMSDRGLWLYNIGESVELWSIAEKSECTEVVTLKNQDPQPNGQLKWNTNSFYFLYKRRFDNVQEYQERKKIRLQQGLSE